MEIGLYRTQIPYDSQDVECIDMFETDRKIAVEVYSFKL